MKTAPDRRRFHVVVVCSGGQFEQLAESGGELGKAVGLQTLAEDVHVQPHGGQRGDVGGGGFGILSHRVGADLDRKSVV